MNTTTSWPRAVSPVARWATACGLAALAVIAGCAAPPKATSANNDLPFEQAVIVATDGLVSQTQKLPAFLAKVESKLNKRAVVVDPMLDATTGQQTAATKLFEKRVTDRMSTTYDQFEILPFQAANLNKAQFLLTGTMTREQGDAKPGVLRLNLALTELKTGVVQAQAASRARDEGLDNEPLPYYKDSPVLLKDKVSEGYVRSSSTAPGQRADAFYLERIATATLINDALLLYNAERYQDALGQYRSALATPSGDQIRVLNGIYLTNIKLGRTAEAEQAFGKVVAFGIAYNELGVKFLFNPGSTEFWSDPKVSGPYGMWLRQIARESTTAKVCMTIVGHTSKTGSEPVNDALSLKRAGAIRERLAAEAAPLAAKVKAEGMGFRQNIVGSGTDNAVDALDRRVEFKITPCAGG